MRDARHRARRALEEARRQAAAEPEAGSGIDIAVRTNIISTGNIGQDGATQAAAEQTATIRQSGPGPRDGGER